VGGRGGRVKRRALLLLGALLMPTTAHARTTKKPTKQKTQKAAATPKPFGPQPLKEARRSSSSSTPRPSLSQRRSRQQEARSSTSKNGSKRGHTSLRGEVYWEEPTYSDRRSLLYLPPGFDPQRPVLIVLYFHGQGATLERDVIARQAVPRQIAETGQNIALVAPQLAVDAADSSAGNFWKPGHFAAYVDEAASG
jgi:hypothetical protein